MRRFTGARGASMAAFPMVVSTSGYAALIATPALGWSSWSIIRRDPTAAKIDARADAMKSSELAAAGFQYVNMDDFWYQCPASQGPNVHAHGRWVTDPAKFPLNGAEDGLAAAVSRRAPHVGVFATAHNSRAVGEVEFQDFVAG